ncbi:MAG: HAD family phosphatase [Verrucomicrobiales bacterium]|nr:HAD family phosphatase [Verrucomicrobiales bacterium]
MSALVAITMLHDFLFDIGNVILKFDFSVGVRRIQDRCSETSAEDLLATISDLTVELEAGQIDVSTYVAKASERLGYSGSEKYFIRAFEDIFTLNEPMVSLIGQLHQKGHPLYLLSNTNGIHVPFFTREYAVFELFSGASYSHEIGHMKPHPQIYQSCIEQHHLNPTHTIYIDDLVANIVGGEKAGLLAIHYDPDQHHLLLEKLAQLGIEFND